MRAPEPTTELDLFSDEIRRDPYPYYSRLRDEAPVHFSARHNAWVVSRYHDAEMLLAHPAMQHWAAAPAAGSGGFARVVARWMTMLDPRSRHELRQLVAPVFAPRQISALRLPLGRMTARILDAAADVGRIEIIGDLAEPIALTTLAKVMGLPEADTEAFRVAARGLIGQLPQAVDGVLVGSGEANATRFATFIRKLLDEPYPLPGTLLAAIKKCAEQSEGLGRTELAAFLVLFLFAGQENMMNFIGNAAFALIEAPDQLERLRDEPRLAAAAVDEVLRFECPVQFVTIGVAADVAVGGQVIPCGSPVLLCIGAANRDERRFAAAEQLDIGRADRGHLAFGLGPLACIGSSLARLQGEVAIAALAARLRRPRFVEPLRLRRAPPVLRGFVELTVAFDG